MAPSEDWYPGKINFVHATGLSSSSAPPVYTYDVAYDDDDTGYKLNASSIRQRGGFNLGAGFEAGSNDITMPASYADEAVVLKRIDREINTPR